MENNFKFCGIKLFEYGLVEHFDSGCSDFYDTKWINPSMKKYEENEDNNYIFRVWTDGDVEVFNCETDKLLNTYLMWDLINEVLEIKGK